VFITTLIELFLKPINNNIKYIAIFGAGKLGVDLSYELQSSGFKVDFFCDNNSEKHGAEINGISCISFKELCKHSGEVLIFVSPGDSGAIYEQLAKSDVEVVFPCELHKILLYLIATGKFANRIFPLGHYYSLYPDLDEIEEKSAEVFCRDTQLIDIDLNEDYQLETLAKMIELYPSLPAWEKNHNDTKLRYFYGNTGFSGCDAVALHCMLRLLKPKRLIEIGSGFSSAVTLDTNEFFLNNSVDLSFIEPYSDRLRSLLRPDDRITLLENNVQDVPFEYFQQLVRGDFLFVDSTHVSKINSDVNYIFFEILPRLNPGVYIHFHDVNYPFEYTKESILQDWKIWNETYLLRAFLQNNRNYTIQFFQDMIQHKYLDKFIENWPTNITVGGDIPFGASIWLRKE